MTRRPLLVLGTLACAALAACEDIPVLPKWDANWVVPLPSQTVSMPSAPGVLLPQGTTFTVTFPAEEQSLGEALGAFNLDETLRAADLVVALAKPASTNVGFDGTLYVGASEAALNDTDPATVRLAFTIPATGTIDTATVTLTTANLDMIRQTAAADASLWVQLRATGTVGSGGHTVTANDTLSVRAQLFARIAMHR